MNDGSAGYAAPITPARKRVTIPGFLLGVLLVSIGVKLAPWGIGIPIFAIGLALILPERRVDRATVTIEGMAFVPDTLIVEAGDTVTWVWNDGAIAHGVDGDDFHSDVMVQGTFDHRFDRPGTYDYDCPVHPDMTGTIEVTG